MILEIHTGHILSFYHNHYLASLVTYAQGGFSRRFLLHSCSPVPFSINSLKLVTLFTFTPTNAIDVEPFSFSLLLL